MPLLTININKTKSESIDYLERNLQELPYFRALLRAVEARFYQKYSLNIPSIDFGCGDGYFAKITFSEKLTLGIDIDFRKLQEAKRLNTYHQLIQTQGKSLPNKNESIASVISNSVLEHIIDVDSVLEEISRILKKKGLFLFCVPNQNFTKYLSIAHFLDEIRLCVLANKYREFFNKISRHVHCDPPEIWLVRLENAGFMTLEWWNYFSPKALKTLEWGHYFGLPYWISKKITGRWVNELFRPIVKIIYENLYKLYIEAPDPLNGTYSFFVCQKL